jgi:hypothetical protein
VVSRFIRGGVVNGVIEVRIKWLSTVYGQNVLRNLKNQNHPRIKVSISEGGIRSTDLFKDRNQIGGNDVRTIGVGNSGSGCERSGRFTFVNAVDAIVFECCAARGIPGTGLDASDPDVVDEADEACRTLAPVGTGGSWVEDTARSVLCCSCS